MDSSRLTSYCTAKIYSAQGDGDVYNFSILPTGEPDEKHVPFMTSATIQFQANTAAEISITIDAPFEEGLKLLNSGVFGTNNILEVQMGYNGSTETSGLVFGSIMAAQTGIQLTPDGVSGTLTAKIGPDIPSRYRASNAFVMGFWDGTSVASFLADMITSLAKSAGYKEVVFEGQGRKLVNDASLYFCSGHSMSLYDILIKLKALAQCNWYNRVSDGEYELVIVDIATLSALKPNRVFVMRGGLFERTDSNKFTYPIISLTPDIQGFSFGTLPSKVIQSDVGRDGTIKTSEAKTNQTDVKMGATKVEKTAPDEPAKKGQAVTVKEPEKREASIVTEDPNAEAEGSTAKNVQQKAITLNSSLVTVGLPSIPFGTSMGAFETIEIAGTDIFDGPYQVNQATHVWSGSGIETTMQITHKGDGSDAGTNEQTAGDS